jgi:hypothetical protein
LEQRLVIELLPVKPLPSLTVVRIAWFVVPAATVSIHDALLCTEPMVGVAMPAAALTKRLLSVAMAMKL